MYTVVKKTKVTKTIELISPTEECVGSSHLHYNDGVNSSCSGCGRNNFGRAVVGIHRSNSSPTKPSSRKGFSSASSGRSSHSHNSHGNGSRGYHFDDDYVVTYTSSSTSHQTVTKRNENDSNNNDVKNR